MQKPLEILAHLTKDHAVRQQRSEFHLLKDPEEDGNPDWFMHVPAAFNPSLDILLTPKIRKGIGEQMVWTQGSWFAFEKGDILYDTPLGYEEWSRALRHFRLCVQVKSASPVSVQDGKRNSGIIVADLLKPNSAKTGVEAQATLVLTQDSFIQFLITGEYDHENLCPDSTER